MWNLAANLRCSPVQSHPATLLEDPRSSLLVSRQDSLLFVLVPLQAQFRLANPRTSRRCNQRNIQAVNLPFCRPVSLLVSLLASLHRSPLNSQVVFRLFSRLVNRALFRPQSHLANLLGSLQVRLLGDLRFGR